MSDIYKAKRVAGRCIEAVHGPGSWPHYAQCSRKAAMGEYCKQHHPDTLAARREERQAAWQAKWKAESGRPGDERPRSEIEALEALAQWCKP